MPSLQRHWKIKVVVWLAAHLIKSTLSVEVTYMDMCVQKMLFMTLYLREVTDTSLDWWWLFSRMQGFLERVDGSFPACAFFFFFS